MERDRELTELAALEDPRSAFHVPDPERGPAAHRDEPTVGGEDDLARLIVELRKNAEEALRLGVVHDRKRAHTRDDPARAPDEILQPKLAQSRESRRGLERDGERDPRS